VDPNTAAIWLGRTESRAPSLSYFTLHFGIRARFPELRHHTLLVPRDFERGFEALYRERRFPEPPIVYLNDTTATDPSTAPPGATNLFVVVTSPAEESHLDWPAQTPIFRASVLALMHRFGIDIEGREVEFERVQTPSYFARVHGNYRGSLYGLDERYRIFGGMFPPANRDPKIRNLLYCGGAVQPGAGMPMVTLSGKFAAQQI